MTEQYPRAEMTSHLLQPAPDLLEIKERTDEQMKKVKSAFGTVAKETLAYQSLADVQALLAEVERLQQEIIGERSWREKVQAHNLKLAGMIAEEHSANSTLLEAMKEIADESSTDDACITRINGIAQDILDLLALYGGKGDTDAALE